MQTKKIELSNSQQIKLEELLKDKIKELKHRAQDQKNLAEIKLSHKPGANVSEYESKLESYLKEKKLFEGILSQLTEVTYG